MGIDITGSTLLRSSIVLMVVLFFLPWTSSSFGPPVSVKVGDPALLTCSSPCHGDVKWTLSKHFKQLLVTKCEKEICVEGDAFTNRTKIIQENSSLLLDPAVYTDAGWFMCYCSGSFLCQTHLEVFAFKVISVPVGETMTLPCYTNTDKNTAESDVIMGWEKDGHLVVEINQGRISYGSGFEQRASVSARRYKDGDLSLTISNFKTSDEGMYRSYLGRKDQGCPDAIFLKVSSTRLQQTVCPLSVSSLVWILLVLLALFFVAVFVWIWKRKKPKFSTPS